MRVNNLSTWGFVAATMLIALCGGRVNASPSSNVTANAGATAIIEAPVTFVKVQDLHFGRVMNSASGDVIVAPNGSVSGNANYVQNSGQQAAKFSLQGSPGQIFNIQVPSGHVTLSGPNNATLNITEFRSDISTGVLGSSATQINIGGRITVQMQQTPGVYTGSFTITATFQ